jgi:hypothetical protein
MINFESDEISSERTGSWKSASCLGGGVKTYSVAVELDEELEGIDKEDLDCHIE